MKPMFEDERISAYLDGELSPDERAQFDGELARSGELRQAVEELRALRESLQALPRHRLGNDFAKRVLQRTAAETQERTPVANESIRAEDQIDWTRPLRSRRPWIWSAVAIATAVLIMVFNRPAKKPVQVAQIEPTKQDFQDRLAARRLQQLPSIGARSPAGGLNATEKPLAANRADGGDLAKNGPVAAPVAASPATSYSAPAALPPPVALGAPVTDRSAALPSARGGAMPSPVDQLATDKDATVPWKKLADRAEQTGDLGLLVRARSPAPMIVAEYSAPIATPKTVRQLFANRGIHVDDSQKARQVVLDAVKSVSNFGSKSSMELNDGSLADKNKAVRSQLNYAATPPVKLGGKEVELRRQAGVDRPPAQSAPVEVVYFVGTRQQLLGLVDDLRANDYRSLGIALANSSHVDGLRELGALDRDRAKAGENWSAKGGGQGGAHVEQSSAATPATRPTAAAAPTAIPPSSPAAPAEKSPVRAMGGTNAYGAIAQSGQAAANGWAATIRLGPNAESAMRRSIAKDEESLGHTGPQSNLRSESLKTAPEGDISGFTGGTISQSHAAEITKEPKDNESHKFDRKKAPADAPADGFEFRQGAAADQQKAEDTIRAVFVFRLAPQPAQGGK